MVQNYLTVEGVTGAPRNTQKKRVGRKVSKVGVASYDLDTVIETVRVIRDSGLERGTMDAFAEKGRIAEKMSTFVTKVYAAAKYQLLDMKQISQNGPREIIILPLSERILDQMTERQAKVEAFLNVPLHRALYERFEGQPLPDDKEIIRIMRDDLGVSSGVLDRARQNMKRAARQAGMFERHQDQMSIPDDVSLPGTDETTYENSNDAQEEISMVTPTPVLSPAVPPASVGSLHVDVRPGENMDNIIELVLKQRPSLDGISSEDEFDAWHRWFESTIEYAKLRARIRR